MRRLYLTGGIVAALIVAIIIYFVAGRGSSPTASSSVLAPAPSYPGHPIIDNIPCETTERVTYHVHAHLALFVNGRPAGVPEGIGIAAPRQTQNTSDGPFVVSGACFYWLHTHTDDGVIHIEAPAPRNFTLGQFFDMWQQGLTTGQVGPSRGAIYAYVNGQRYNGNPRDIALASHAVIQLDVGQDTAPAAYSFQPGL